jgi:hypothetical protein
MSLPSYRFLMLQLLPFSRARRAIYAGMLFGLVLLITNGLIPTISQAQWEVRAYVGQTNCLYFLDEVGHPEIGLAGTHSGLMRSTDTGHTWTFVPNTDRILFRDFSFKDGMVGWAAAGTGAFKTTDAGRTWTQQFSAMSTAVKYIRSTGYLFVSNWSSTLSMQSTNEGLSWTAFAPTSANGYAELDDSTVFMTTLSGQARFTTDGGKNWTQSPMNTEVWQPAALKVSRQVVAVSEQRDQAMRASSLSAIWDLLTPIPMATGCTRGDDDFLVAQSNEQMFVSTDQGSSWNGICGPMGPIDSRFFVRGHEIFGVSYNGFLYYNPTGSVSPSKQVVLHTIPEEITGDGCEPTNGAINIAIAACNAKILNVSVTGDPAFMVLAPTPPATMKSGYAIAFTYDPVVGGPHTATVNLRLEIDGNIIDTTVVLVGRKSSKLNAEITPEELKLAVNADCDGKFIPVTLLNKACIAYTVDSFTVSDPGHFEVSGLNVGDIVGSQGDLTFNIRAMNVMDVNTIGVLNVYVSSGLESAVLTSEIELRNTATVKNPFSDKQSIFPKACEAKPLSADFVNFFCDYITIDSAHFSNTIDFQPMALKYPIDLGRFDTLHIPYMALPPRPGPTSTRVTVYYHMLNYSSQLISTHTVYSNFAMGLPDDTLKMETDGRCPKFDSTFEFSNPLCDVMKITRITPALQPQVQFTLPTLPAVLQPGASVPIAMTSNVSAKGTIATKMAVQYEIYGQQFDTTFYLSIKIPKTFRIESNIAKQSFGRTSLCAPKRRVVPIENDLCVDVTYDKIALASTSDPNFKLTQVPTLPLLLKPGQRDSIIVEYAPTATGNAAGSVEVKLHSATTSVDTFFVVDGIGTGSANAALSDAELAFGSALSCKKLRSTTVVRNDGCEALDLTAVVLPSGNFTLVAPTLPQPLAPGDSVELVFETAKTIAGTLQDNALIRLYTKQNIEQLLDCELTALLEKETPNVLAASLNVGEHSECAPIDSSIVVFNRNKCDEMTVEGAFTTTDASITGSNTATIPAGGSARFIFRIMPNTNNAVTLRLFGTSFDTSVTVSYAFVAGVGNLTMSVPSTTFETNACDAVTRQVTISNTSCTPLNVADIALTPSGTRFSIVDALNFPLQVDANGSITFSVRFDPTSTGANTATLRVIGEKGAPLTSTLTGNFIPAQQLSAALTSSGVKDVIVNDELEVDLAMTSNVALPLALDALVARFAYDTDMLTLLRVEPAAGWSVSSNQAVAGGSQITLAHSASTYTNGDPIAKLRFKSMLAKDHTGTVTLDDLKLNPDDPHFAQCVAHVNFVPSGNEVTIKYLCGGETLRRALSGELAVKNIRVRPHPASSKDKLLIISFESAKASSMKIDLVNVLGVVSSETRYEATQGENELQLPLSGVSSGWHLLRIKGDQGSAGVRVLITE